MTQSRVLCWAGLLLVCGCGRVETPTAAPDTKVLRAWQPLEAPAGMALRQLGEDCLS